MSIDLDSKVKIEVGRKLKELRERKNLTQDEVAKGIGITTNYYARIERGKENPTLAVFHNYTKLLKVKSSDILPF